MKKLLGIYAPGLLIISGIALGATTLAGFFPSYIGAVFIAVVLGVVIANTVRLDPRNFEPGVRLGLSKFLKLAIVLLGAGVTFQEILGFGPQALLVVVVLIAFVFASTAVLSRVMKLGMRQALLIAVGISICGNTAIATTAPVLKAEKDEIAMAVGIVTLFGVVAVVLYPFVGMLLSMPDLVFGFWAGTAINDTSQVVAAGFIYSEEAGRVATTVKLARNVMIVPVVVGVGWFYAIKSPRFGAKKVRPREIFPTFVLGFLALALFNSLGWIPETVADLMVATSGVLILVALSGIGLGIRAAAFRKIGWRPFVVGFLVEVLLALAALGLIWTILT